MSTTIAYIVHTDEPGMNVYLDGTLCTDCDPHDPMLSRGVACHQAYAHALCTVRNWISNGVRAARISLVQVVDTGDYEGMVADARAQLRARHAPAGSSRAEHT